MERKSCELGFVTDARHAHVFQRRVGLALGGVGGHELSGSSQLRTTDEVETQIVFVVFTLLTTFLFNPLTHFCKSFASDFLNL